MFTVEKLENTGKPGKGQQQTPLTSVIQRWLCCSGPYLTKCPVRKLVFFKRQTTYFVL